MGFFSRQARYQVPFWEAPPTRTSDPTILMHFGIMAGQRSDGPAKIAAGWAIWRLGNVGSPHVFEFIREGYEMWHEAALFDRSEARQFLEAMLNRLRNEPPAPYY